MSDLPHYTLLRHCKWVPEPVSAVNQEGHILAVEYLEETPLLLGRPGMGLKLNTFYRRKHERDAGHLDIRKGPLADHSRSWWR